MLNLTPHTITLHTPEGTLTFPPSGKVARVATRQQHQRFIYIDGVRVPVYTRYKGKVFGIPARGGPFLVSSMVLDALPPGTLGVYAPDTGPSAIRNDRGEVIAVVGLIGL